MPDYNRDKNWHLPQLPDQFSGKGVQVNIIDSCIDYKHQSLSNKIIITNDYTISCKPISSNLTDKNAIHGTCMGGIISADDGKFQYTGTAYSIKDLTIKGVAPKSQLKPVMADDIMSNTKEVVEDIYHKIHDIKTKSGTQIFPDFKRTKLSVINLSAGQKGHADEWQDWARRLCNDEKENHLIIAAAGNDGLDLNEQSDFSKGAVYPAAIKLPNVCKKKNIDNIISVAAIGEDNILYSQSNYGDKYVDMAAPGMAIQCPVPNNKSDKLSGTSQACAVVSGTVADMIGVGCNPYLTSKEAAGLLLDNSNKKTDLSGRVKDNNILDIENTLKAACYQSVQNTTSSEKLTTTEEMYDEAPYITDSFIYTVAASCYYLLVRPNIGNDILEGM